MNARDERTELRVKLLELGGTISSCWPERAGKFDQERAEGAVDATLDAILAAGYRKPRTINSLAELAALPAESAVQTSDTSDTVVLQGEDGRFINAFGGEVGADDLWRYGTKPFTVIYEPDPS